MKELLICLCSLYLFGGINPGVAQNQIEPSFSPSPVKVIFETDMCTDVDDVGALATLHALADMHEAEILAIGYNEVCRDGVAAIDAINTWYNRGDMPIGVFKKELPSPDTSGYLSRTAKFPNDISSDQAEIPTAVDVYVSTLKNQPDSSVVIVSVGFLNNLGDLLDSHPDLIARKVQKLVIMGALQNDTWNLVRHGMVETSEKIFNNWPTPIVISELGEDIHTGQDLEYTDIDNPVRASYFHYFNQSFEGRSSWDQIAVLFAVRGLKYFTLHSDGEGRLTNGYVMHMKPGWRSYIRQALSTQEYERLINHLMVKPPAGL